MFCILVPISVTTCGEISPLLRNIKCLWTILWSKGNFYCFKWQNIEDTITPSGHTWPKNTAFGSSFVASYFPNNQSNIKESKIFCVCFCAYFDIIAIIWHFACGQNPKSCHMCHRRGNESQQRHLRGASSLCPFPELNPSRENTVK